MARRGWVVLRRAALRAAAVLAVLLGVIFVVGEIHRRRDATEALLASRDTLADFELRVLESTGSSTLHELRLQGERGLSVEGSLRLPAARGPHPAIVILG